MAYQAVRVAGAKYHLKAVSLDALHLCMFQNTAMYCYKVGRARELNIVPNRKDLVCPPLTKKASL